MDSQNSQSLSRLVPSLVQALGHSVTPSNNSSTEAHLTGKASASKHSSASDSAQQAQESAHSQ